MSRSPDREELARFDLNERLVHWTTALLTLVLVVTGTILYLPSLMLKVGHRATLVNLHVISGLALVAPVLIGLAGPWRKGLAADIRRLDRWRQGDFDYFWPSRAGRPAGKFNGGQKLAAGLIAGCAVVMLVTGVVMRWSPPFPNSWASGATLVHDTVYLLMSLVVVGHIATALSRREQLRSIFTGSVPRAWAEQHAPAWLAGSDSEETARPRARLRPRPSAPRGGAAAAGRSQGSG